MKEGDFMTTLEKIYYNLDELMDNCKDLQDTKKALESISKFYKDQTSDLESCVSDYGSTCQKQGFIYGFRFAISLIFNEKIVM